MANNFCVNRNILSNLYFVLNLSCTSIKLALLYTTNTITDQIIIILRKMFRGLFEMIKSQL